MKKLLPLIFIFSLFFACSKQNYIEQRPIQFDSTRIALSQQYMQEHYGIERTEPAIHPKMVVIHWTAILSFEKTFKVFDPPTLEGREDIRGAGALNVSSHYLIDRKGNVAQLLPDTVMARHVIGLNHVAIGIENVGSDEHRLTRSQLKANERLIRKLTADYDIEYVIGHFEYRLFEGHPLWREKNDDYRTCKIDPGAVFMFRLRDQIKDLNLKGAPLQTGALKK